MSFSVVDVTTEKGVFTLKSFWKNMMIFTLAELWP